jgi:hypothetical protein
MHPNLGVIDPGSEYRLEHVDFAGSQSSRNCRRHLVPLDVTVNSRIGGVAAGRIIGTGHVSQSMMYSRGN